MQVLVGAADAEPLAPLVLAVAGMRCMKNCGRRVLAALQAVPGVSRAEVDVTAGAARVWPGAVNVLLCVEAVTAAGYPARATLPGAWGEAREPPVAADAPPTGNCALVIGAAPPPLLSPQGREGPTVDVHLSVSGMSCAACAGKVEAALCAVDGVASAMVSAASHRAVVAAHARVLPGALVAAVERAGYACARMDALASVEAVTGARDADVDAWRDRLMVSLVLCTPMLIAHAVFPVCLSCARVMTRPMYGRLSAYDAGAWSDGGTGGRGAELRVFACSLLHCGDADAGACGARVVCMCPLVTPRRRSSSWAARSMRAPRRAGAAAPWAWTSWWRPGPPRRTSEASLTCSWYVPRAWLLRCVRMAADGAGAEHGARVRSLRGVLRHGGHAARVRGPGQVPRGASRHI